MKNTVKISDYINENFKEYALYTLMNRGIPSFYDSLTNVQRLILLNAPLKSTKTLSLVGDVIKSGYHHGDSSLVNAINRLARPFDCSEEILIGDGFFGTQINQDAASARYTSVYLNPKIDGVIKKYIFLNKSLDDGTFSYLNIDFPLGLLLPIVGIAVGYRTMILPRKFDDIKSFLEGSTKKVVPYFKGFSGKVERYENLENSWILEGEVDFNDFDYSVHIKSLPPLMKYTSFLNKLNKLLENFDFELTNSSSFVVDIFIRIKDIKKEDWYNLKERISKATKIIFKESLVFIKGNQVLEYDSIELYLEDFKVKNEFLRRDEFRYNIEVCNKELEFLTSKLIFLEWMIKNKIDKNGDFISEDKIISFLKKNFKEEIITRLDNIKLRKLNNDEILLTNQQILKYKSYLKKSTDLLNKQNEKLKNTSLKLHTKNKNGINLFEYDSLKEIDEIEVYIKEDEI